MLRRTVVFAYPAELRLSPVEPRVAGCADVSVGPAAGGGTFASSLSALTGATPSRAELPEDPFDADPFGEQSPACLEQAFNVAAGEGAADRQGALARFDSTSCNSTMTKHTEHRFDRRSADRRCLPHGGGSLATSLPAPRVTASFVTAAPDQAITRRLWHGSLGAGEKYDCCWSPTPGSWARNPGATRLFHYHHSLDEGDDPVQLSTDFTIQNIESG